MLRIYNHHFDHFATQYSGSLPTRIRTGTIAGLRRMTLPVGLQEEGGRAVTPGLVTTNDKKGQSSGLLFNVGVTGRRWRQKLPTIPPIVLLTEQSARLDLNQRPAVYKTATLTY